MPAQFPSSSLPASQRDTTRASSSPRHHPHSQLASRHLLVPRYAPPAGLNLQSQAPGAWPFQLPSRRWNPSPKQLPASVASESLRVPGLLLLPGFVTEAEERELLAAVEGGAWTTLAKRRVQHYGHMFDYTARHVGERLGPLPQWVTAVAGRVQQVTGADPHPTTHGRACMGADSAPTAPPIDQLTVNEYTPGVGLSAHIDTHSAFAALSASAGCGAVEAVFLWATEDLPAPATAQHRRHLLAVPGRVRCDGAARRGEQIRPLLLPPRSLLVMAGESRYAWQHYIPHRKSDLLEDGTTLQRSSKRVSLTFRSVRAAADTPCTCPYPTHCDSQASALPPTRLALLQQQQQQLLQQPRAAWSGHTGSASELGSTQAPDSTSRVERAVGAGGSASGDAAGAAVGAGSQDGRQQQQQQQRADRSAAELEAEHVHKVYDAIAPHFSSTRFAIWPRVRDFIMGLPAGAVVADVGCGNGKYFGVRQDLAVIGSDRSTGLAAVAMQRLLPDAGDSHCSNADKADVMLADALSLPFRAASLEAVLNIAVLHHISTASRRLRVLAQLIQVLRPGGKALVTVWAAEQEEPSRTLAKWTRIGSREQGQPQTHDVHDVHDVATPQSAPSGPLVQMDTAGQQQQQQGGARPQQPQQRPMHSASAASEQQLHPLPGTSVAREQGSEAGPTGLSSPPVHSAPSGAAAQRQLDGGDFFVPWHLPLHRAETRKAVQAVTAAATAATTSAAASAALPSRHSTTHTTQTPTSPDSAPDTHCGTADAVVHPGSTVRTGLSCTGSGPRGPGAQSSSSRKDGVAKKEGSGTDTHATEAVASGGIILPAVTGGRGTAAAVDGSAPVAHVAAVAGAGAKAVAAAARSSAAAAPPGAPVLSDAKAAVVFQRYYHLFEAGELAALAGQLGPGVRVVDEFFDRSNWCVVLQRL
ncbi:MAG: hypothetical protein WDW38_007352 [Sanguina aurantia]